MPTVLVICTHTHLHARVHVYRVTNLGGVAMSEEEKEEVLKQRKDAEMIYQVHCDCFC